jgi:hypothetical protein
MFSDDDAIGPIHLGHLTAQRAAPYRRVEVDRLVGVEHLGQPGAHRGMRERCDPPDHESPRDHFTGDRALLVAEKSLPARHFA